MTRKEALELYITKIIDSYSIEKREEELEQLMMENWSSVDGWNNLPDSIRNEFESEKFCEGYNSNRYDIILRFKLRDDLKGVKNDFIANQISEEINSGSPVYLEPCPCCGYRTLEKRNDFEICWICWWEDDGQDNENSDTLLGGPNEGVDLTMARYNYLKYGIFSPNRADLKEISHDYTKYEKGRTFIINKDNCIEEPTVNWVSDKITTPNKVYKT